MCPRWGMNIPKRTSPRDPPRWVSEWAGLWAGCRTGLSWLPVVAPSPSQALGCDATAQSSSLFFPLMKTLLQGTHDGHIPLGSPEHLAEGGSATQPHITEGHRGGKIPCSPRPRPAAHKRSNLVSKTPKVTLGFAVVVERHRESRRAFRDLGQPDGHGTARVPPGSFLVTTIAWKHLPLSWEQ